ncbi:hypothetical protein BHU72_02680 [Desulfuribacillus stibiiarsenatis]|uniref:DUF2953 domain-containing protein n=1 Tax=Desulfuribacillus stibiiarsenatis TaxID=1390249 RepID=A0A1E5L6C8_9FIRM|nr:DUF2953 domain-containing protein [Desulfuribacillus stibiiarsenatis]OEH85717.1 hypothetical protein BHU72_02680 [Desulfuribacillus stibiiarsenatis]
MPWYWLLLIFSLFITFLIMVTNTKAEIYFQRHGEDNDYLLITITILYFIKLKKEIAVIDLNKKGNDLGIQLKDQQSSPLGSDLINIKFESIRRVLEKINQIVKRLHHVIQSMRKILRGFKVTTFHWTTHVGINDAAVLGPVVGGIWAIKGTIMQYFFFFFPLKEKPKVHVNPDYYQYLFKMQFHCIFQFKVGYAIYAGIKLFYLYWKGVRHV